MSNYSLNNPLDLATLVKDSLDHITDDTRQQMAAAVLRALQFDNDIQIEQAADYGEPGYTLDGRAILFADWNQVDRATGDLLEELGFELEWSDEWYVDPQTAQAYRTKPDGWEWQCQLVYVDGDVITPDDGPEAAIEACALTDQAQAVSALPPWVGHDDLLEAGYAKLPDEYESGFHPGQDDDPAAVGAYLFDELHAESVVFLIESRGQFDTRFSAYWRV